jgi:hypothetical protein
MAGDDVSAQEAKHLPGDETEDMEVRIWRLLASLWRAAGARIDEAIIASAVGTTSADTERVNAAKRRLRKRNDCDDGDPDWFRRDRHES